MFHSHTDVSLPLPCPLSKNESIKILQQRIKMIKVVLFYQFYFSHPNGKVWENRPEFHKGCPMPSLESSPGDKSPCMCLTKNTCVWLSQGGGMCTPLHTQFYTFKMYVFPCNEQLSGVFLL